MATATLNVDTLRRKRDRLVERLIESASETLNFFAIYVGDRLGLYRVLVEDGPMRAAELACRTGTQARYVREWLEQQTVAGILEVEDHRLDETERRYFIPAGHDEVLADRESLNYLAPLAQVAVGAVKPISRVVEAFRTGAGVPLAEYGADFREGQARMNRAMFLQELGKQWLPSIPDVHARLTAATGALVADFGCGAGWSSIGIAKSYPRARVDGFDIDAPSVEMARANAEEAGVSDRVRFHVRDAGDPDLAGRYDVVTAFECVHDMSNPVDALRTMHRLAKEDGSVIIMDERTGESFAPTGSDLERFLYGCSVLHCLPVGMAEQPSAGTGTVMRPDTLRRYASEAGFRGVEVLPIEHFFFRFYLLKP